jgi:murein DD-endopeptidase MepM/ murein hydrolase activator NlpD
MATGANKPIRTGTRLAALLLLAALAACSRSGGPAPIVSGEGGAPPPSGTESSPEKQEGGTTIVVQRGETLYSIARRHGVSLRALIDRNRIAPPFAVEPGQRLSLPVPQLYTVARGDTIYGIARRFGVPMREVIRVNAVRPPYVITPGQKLRLPGAEAAPAAARAAPEAKGVVSATNEALAALPPPGAAKPARSRPAPALPPRRSGPATIAPPPPREGGKFLWPVQGRVLVGFGSRGGGLHNDGINIAAPEGTPVRAAEAGVVAYAGNELAGFGNLLLVKHSGGWMSAYAHGRELLVGRGDLVKRGQTIARVGRTGNVTRPQLHFELRRGDRAVNPVQYMMRLAFGPSARRGLALVSEAAP